MVDDENVFEIVWMSKLTKDKQYDSLFDAFTFFWYLIKDKEI